MNPDRPIAERFARGRPLRSLEFFPPKDDNGVAALRGTAEALRRMGPDFVSVTYGAGGTTRDRTAQVSALLKGEFGFTVMPHLTCVGHTRGELETLADQIHAQGFRNIMTLRGDAPKGATTFPVLPDGFRHATELVALLKRRHPDFCLGVAGYPEKHPEAPSLEADLTHLKRKVDAGADFITTQLFFDNAVYYRFVERCRAEGITVPIVPGIMPVLSLKQIQRFTQLCGSTLPAQLAARLEVAADNADVVEMVGIDWALQQIRGLLANGAPGYHLYILNRARGALALSAGLAA
jgi:methylenetetrahydrofolate reductase (NADPH)